MRVDFATEFNSPGTHILEARSVEGDNALSEDDVRSLSLEVKAATGVLIVDGRPGAKLLDGQAGYLATALDPRVPSSERRCRASPDFRGATHSPAQPGQRQGDRRGGTGDGAASLVRRVDALQRGEALSRTVESCLALTSATAEGCWCSWAMPWRWDNYNRFGFAGGQGVLPGELRRAVDFASLRGVEGSADAHAETVGHFAADKLTHPLVAEFADRPDSGLFVARVPRYMPITVDPQRAEVPLRYSNGDAAWIASGHGSGRVLVCTTTANMEWNNLPAKGTMSRSCSTRCRSCVRGTVTGATSWWGGALEPLSPGETSMPLKVWTADAEPRDPALVPHGGGWPPRLDRSIAPA